MSTEHANESHHDRREGVRSLVLLTLCLAFYLALVWGPMLLSRHVGPWVGVAGALAAIPVWVFIGPRPMPGLVAGLVSVSGLAGLLFAAALAIVRAF